MKEEQVDEDSEMFSDITNAVMCGLSDVSFTEDQRIDLCNAIAWAIMQYDYNKKENGKAPKK